MPAGQQLSHQAPLSGNGESTPHDLFVLTDEQILEIEPEGEGNVAPPFRAASSPLNSSSAVASQDVIPSEQTESRDHGNNYDHASSQSARHDSSLPAASRNDKLGQNAPDAASTNQ